MSGGSALRLSLVFVAAAGLVWFGLRAKWTLHRRLRDHPDVVLELKRFWKFISQEPNASFMLKSNYIEMHICMYVRITIRMHLRRAVQFFMIAAPACMW